MLLFWIDIIAFSYSLFNAIVITRKIRRSANLGSCTAGTFGSAARTGLLCPLSLFCSIVSVYLLQWLVLLNLLPGILFYIWSVENYQSMHPPTHPSTHPSIQQSFDLSTHISIHQSSLYPPVSKLFSLPSIYFPTQYLVFTCVGLSSLIPSSVSFMSMSMVP